MKILTWIKVLFDFLLWLIVSGLFDSGIIYLSKINVMGSYVGFVISLVIPFMLWMRLMYSHLD